MSSYQSESVQKGLVKFLYLMCCNKMLNKKVLLRERKRHTDRNVSSTPYAVLYRGYLPWPEGDGVPTLAGGGVPTLARGRGVPTLAGEGYLPWPGRGRGTYLCWGGGERYLPWLGGGVPTLARWVGTLGYPLPPSGPGRGTALPPSPALNRLKTLASPSLGSVKFISINGVFTLLDTENDTCTETDGDNMRKPSHCSITEIENDADSMQNCLHVLNNKVLLRERKRHTDRGVSSTPSVTRGGVPPSPSGYPPARSNRGVPRWGTPPPGYPLARSDRGNTRGGVPPSRGTPLARSDQGGTQGGVPPPPSWLDLAGVPPPAGVD